MGDVVVFGLDTQTVPLDDIMMDVPHARTVTIPEDKALRSKDLWRAISQKRIFRLSPDPSPKVTLPVPAAPPPAAPTGPSQAETRLVDVEAENASLKAENASLRARVELLTAHAAGNGKLDEILQLLRERPVLMAAPAANVKGVSKIAMEEGVVEVDAPAFVPGEIRPKDVETRVEVSSETSHGGSVSGATDALRRLRQGQ